MMTTIPETYAQFGQEAGEIMWHLHQRITQLEKERDGLRAEIELLKHNNLALRAECKEQARLLGMSAERELKLRAENERLRAAIEQARNYMTYVSKELWDEFLSEWIEK